KEPRAFARLAGGVRDLDIDGGLLDFLDGIRTDDRRNGASRNWRDLDDRLLITLFVLGLLSVDLLVFVSVFLLPLFCFRLNLGDRRYRRLRLEPCIRANAPGTDQAEH